MTTELEAELEKISFENLVRYYKEELLKIDNGSRVKHLLNDGERSNLRKYGIITDIYSRQTGSFRVVVLTQRAKRVLKNV